MLTSLIEPNDNRHIQLHTSVSETEIHVELGGVALQGPTAYCIAFTEPPNGWVPNMIDLYAGSSNILLNNKTVTSFNTVRHSGHVCD